MSWTCAENAKNGKTTTKLMQPRVDIGTDAKMQSEIGNEWQTREDR